jgi:hypothetical protein
MKAMLDETATDIMGLLLRVVGVQGIQNRQAIFYRCIFLKFTLKSLQSKLYGSVCRMAPSPGHTHMAVLRLGLQQKWSGEFLRNSFKI